MHKLFSDRLITLRKELNINQSQLAKTLGVTPGYISKLEKNICVPSDQLTLSIARFFNVLPDWLRTGDGEKYDIIERTTYPLRGAICKVINSMGPMPLDLYTYASLVGINIYDLDNEEARIKCFSTIDADKLIQAVVSILKEGDKTKIDAMRAMLFNLCPSKDEEISPDEEKSLRLKNATSIMNWAKRLEGIGDLLAALKEFHYALMRSKIPDYQADVYELIKKEYIEFIKRNPSYNRVLEDICSIVKTEPGINDSKLRRHFKQIKGNEFSYISSVAEDLGYIKRIKKGQSTKFYPTEE